MGKLTGKVALVTGAGRGIGRGIAIELAKEGASVAVNYSGRVDAAAETVVILRALGVQAEMYQANVGVPAEAAALVEQVVQDFSKIDILVNNAGICPFADFFDIDEENWRRTLDVNLGGAFFCSQAAARHMRDAGQGAILHISTVTSYRAGATQVHYAASKGGMNSLTSSMAFALGKYGIRVNAILCGGVATEINTPENEPIRTKMPTRYLPTGRTGDPEDLGKAVVFLCSDDSEWITGTLFPVDGGYLVT
ncbi:SDR family NAD(P)-dependent oxidoreductase [Paenibacillus spongiae]|uniref:Glucose 1-dehydrogenase n=1 Tax=Paenibacillus spongiae TaxID=2909671 RepID=A0ABY5S6S5_9BACL|nr:glucose 1-dehydrogenase [Paenibacillus spongiae]UVI29611.1 glucose 1-dehydrogenase [Paenibacillus spongiae]